jgi:hypothetical protein
MVFNWRFLLIFGAVIFASNNLFSQSLQFSQVLTFNGVVQVSSNGVTDGVAYTCPVGKVWKIESLNIYRPPVNVTLNTGFMTYKVNGSALGVSPLGNTPMIVNAVFPIWLKPGDTVQASYNGLGNYNPNTGLSYFISILEFDTP